MKKNSILQRAHNIVHERAEEKARQYGPFIESMEKGAKIASLMTGKEVTAEMGYAFMIGLKLSRESYSHKEDNLLDAVAYISSLNDYRNDIPTKLQPELKGSRRRNSSSLQTRKRRTPVPASKKQHKR